MTAVSYQNPRGGGQATHLWSEGPLDRKRLILAAEVTDAQGRGGRPGALLLEGARVMAAGPAASIGRPADAEVTELPGAVVVPGLVNAHAHLDLTHVGPRPAGTDFVGWIDGIRALRATEDYAIAASVARGIALAQAGGTALIGDIAGDAGGGPSLVPRRELARAGLGGVSYLEFFGLGARQGRAVASIRRLVAETAPEVGGVRLGVQPHAPYSCGPEVYAAAAGLGVPVATHLAETRQEIEFVRDRGGPLVGMLERLGVLDETVTASGLHPVDHLAEALAAAPFACAHANYVEPAHLERLAAWHASVVYCPRASAYFGHRAHPYRPMLAAGLNVALGTDSIICLDTPQRLSILDEMRFLFARDGTDPRTLLEMATVNGARALGFGTDLVSFAPGPVAGVIALPCDDGAADPLRAALGRDEAPRWISEHGA